MNAHRRRWRRAVALMAVLLCLTVVVPQGTAQARTGFASDRDKPSLTRLLVGYRMVWQPSGAVDKHGRVKREKQLQWNDRIASWINQHATRAQRFRALQNAEYLASNGSGYDQSITIADGLGERLGRLYAEGRIDGRLPLTTRLLNTSTGLVGDYLDTARTKDAFDYPRPYLRAAAAGRTSGDSAQCAPARVNAQSLVAIRKGQPWASAAGGLRISRVPATADGTTSFARGTIALDAGYGRPGLCLGGSFPSGHTTAAYAAGITLATLLPELAPSILARTSEAANNRIVLGVHYPLDVIGGRIAGQAAAAARWSDARFRARVLNPARGELISYLEKACGDELAACIAADRPYANDGFAGQAPPLFSRQVVTDRGTAVAAYTERLSYGFAPVAPTTLGPSVPSGAQNLLRTAFPTLTSAQRRAVLAQTESASGNVLDTTLLQTLGQADGSWQRLNLAAAMSATVLRHPDGRITVLAVGDRPVVFDE